jgi:hypothetical protein
MMEKRHYRNGFFVHRNKAFHTETSPDTSQHNSKKMSVANLETTAEAKINPETKPQPVKKDAVPVKLPPPKKRTIQVTTGHSYAALTPFSYHAGGQSNSYTIVKERTPEQQMKTIAWFTYIGFSLAALALVLWLVLSFVPVSGFIATYIMLGSWLTGLIISIITTRKTRKYGSNTLKWIARIGLILALLFLVLVIVSLVLVL